MRKSLSITFLSLFILLGTRSGYAWIYPIVSIPGAAVAEGPANTFLQQYFLKYQSQAKFAKGFANAGIFSSHAATQRGYQGYKLLNITVGTMAGLQAPSSDMSFYKDIKNKLQNQGDIYLGVALSSWAVQAGMHLNFIWDRLYFSVKFGKLQYHISDFQIDSMTAGGMLNIQIIKAKAPPVKFVLWRGLSLGTGLMYQRNNTKYKYNASEIPYTSGTYAYIIKPSFKIGIKTESYVIPIELSTALRLLWFLNLHVGVGIDFAKGTSKLNYSSYGYLTVSGGATGTGIIMVTGSQDGKGSRNYLPKIFAGVGFNIGPVLIDIPVTYYFMNGLNVGVSAGVVF